MATLASGSEDNTPQTIPEDCMKTALTDEAARTDVLNRLRRAEGQLRGIQRMVEEGEDCLKIGVAAMSAAVCDFLDAAR